MSVNICSFGFYNMPFSSADGYCTNVRIVQHLGVLLDHDPMESVVNRASNYRAKRWLKRYCFVS